MLRLNRILFFKIYFHTLVRKKKQNLNNFKWKHLLNNNFICTNLLHYFLLFFLKLLSSLCPYSIIHMLCPDNCMYRIFSTNSTIIFFDDFLFFFFFFYYYLERC